MPNNPIESDPPMRFHVYIGGNDEGPVPLVRMHITRKASEIDDDLSNLKVGQGWLSPDESAHWMRIE